MDAERASILEELSQLATEDAAAREKEAKRQARYEQERQGLLGGRALAIQVSFVQTATSTKPTGGLDDEQWDGAASDNG